jgi:hypothetical protein
MGNKFVKTCCCDAITGNNRDSFDSGPMEIPLHRRIQQAGHRVHDKQRILITTDLNTWQKNQEAQPFDEEKLAEQKCK